MLEIRPARPREFPEEKAEIYALWQAVYGDDAALIDRFFQSCPMEEMLLLKEDGALRTCAAVPAVTLHLPGGERVNTAYLYALGTDPAQRERGFARLLLRYADFYLQERRLPCVTLVPAQPSLFRFFGGVGYEPFFAKRMAEVPAAQVGAPLEGTSARPASPEAYNALREALLAGTFHLEYPSPLIAFQQYLSQSSGGELLLLDLPGGQGCAAVELLEEMPGFSGVTGLVKELLTRPGEEGAALALIAQALPAARYALRLPVDRAWPAGGYGQPFGVIKWYDQALRRRVGEAAPGYLGLAFD